MNQPHIIGVISDTHGFLRPEPDTAADRPNDPGVLRHKGVIRRTMGAERNLRPSFSVNPRRRDDVFQAAFDAFCLHWNLYGMQNDEPLLLKLAVNITPYGTLIHIPAYPTSNVKTSGYKMMSATRHCETVRRSRSDVAPKEGALSRGSRGESRSRPSVLERDRTRG
jgi:hypothetical protein